MFHSGNLYFDQILASAGGRACSCEPEQPEQPREKPEPKREYGFDRYRQKNEAKKKKPVVPGRLVCPRCN